MFQEVGEYVGAIGRLFDSEQLGVKLSSNERAPIEQEYTRERAGAFDEKV